MINNFLNYRIKQTLDITDYMSTLQSVQINPSEMCNRTCVFCPRNDPKIYKNHKKYISVDTCIEIGKQLSDFDFKGRIGFVGFGEPLLNENIVSCVAAIRKHCNTAQWIEINTNGDFLTRDLIIKLYNAGCTNIAISMYDKDESIKFNEMFSKIKIEYVLRHHYDVSKNYNLNLVNRIGILNQEIEENNNSCYIPFYKMFIDWNGDYLLCEQDWGRVTKKYNINEINISNFWIDKLERYRTNLINNNRKNQTPCNSCNINGILFGQESFKYIKNHMKKCI